MQCEVGRDAIRSLINPLSIVRLPPASVAHTTVGVLRLGDIGGASGQKQDAEQKGKAANHG